MAQLFNSFSIGTSLSAYGIYVNIFYVYKEIDISVYIYCIHIEMDTVYYVHVCHVFVSVLLCLKQCIFINIFFLTTFLTFNTFTSNGMRAGRWPSVFHKCSEVIDQISCLHVIGSKVVHCFENCLASCTIYGYCRS